MRWADDEDWSKSGMKAVKTVTSEWTMTERFKQADNGVLSHSGRALTDNDTTLLTL